MAPRPPCPRSYALGILHMGIAAGKLAFLWESLLLFLLTCELPKLTRQLSAPSLTSRLETGVDYEDTS